MELVKKSNEGRLESSEGDSKESANESSSNSDRVASNQDLSRVSQAEGDRTQIKKEEEEKVSGVGEVSDEEIGKDKDLDEEFRVVDKSNEKENELQNLD